MRKTFLAIIAMFICLTAVWSDSFYAIGGAGTLGLAGEKGHIGSGGLYFDTYYAYPQEGTDLSHGFGTQLEATIPAHHQGTLVNLMVGYALEWNMMDSGLMELYMLLGPSLSCQLGDPNGGLISLGGGVELNGNFYFDQERTMGLSVGLKGTLEASTFNKANSTNLHPVGWLGAHVGFAMKIKPNWENLPSHSYAAEHSIEVD